MEIAGILTINRDPLPPRTKIVSSRIEDREIQKLCKRISVEDASQNRQWVCQGFKALFIDLERKERLRILGDRTGGEERSVTNQTSNKGDTGMNFVFVGCEYTGKSTLAGQVMK